MTSKAKITESLIAKCRIRFDDGERDAVLDAIDLCARAGMAMPPWLVEAYSAAYTRWATYGVRTLDEAFGVKHKRKGRRMPELQERESLKAAVVAAVNKLRREGETIDEFLFERAGAELDKPMPMGQVRDIYYDETNHWRQFNEGIRKMPVPDWLKKMVLFEVGSLCKGKAPTEKQLTQVGARVNLSANQVRAIYSEKGD